MRWRAVIMALLFASGSAFAQDGKATALEDNGEEVAAVYCAT